MSSIKKFVCTINNGIILMCMLGFTATTYAYVVDAKVAADDLYEPMCDISEHVSCTKAFTSKYGKGFGIIPETSPFYISNSIYGLIFYAWIAIMSFSESYIGSVIFLASAAASNFSTIYTIYILCKIHDFCVVCASTFIINAILLILAVKKHRKLLREPGIRL